MKTKGKQIIISNLPESKMGKFYNDAYFGKLDVKKMGFIPGGMTWEEDGRSLNSFEERALSEALRESLIDKPTLKGRK